VTKGKAWTVEEELKLRELWESGEPLSSIAAELSKTKVAVANKVSHLGLKDDSARRSLVSSSSSELELPVELPTVQEAVKIIGGAMLAMTKPGVSKAQVERLKAVVDAASKYKQCMADLVRYKELERENVELRRKFEELRKKYEELAAKKTNRSTG